eukprot:CAMPEP_0202468052 /NCGR_PEP_ID=MMETSP1360-20130828/73977_1 /ASSEMBLY_ACC=CAM_ASM_000848 /TAXON_ID=515479 /ORGANISM="Licmophora paradoxa, Strain CCMP2313" /LENGTH=47 /DNA_ID= /DNA_START= /DNA_END= /DNA_ORIENTATION=
MFTVIKPDGNIQEFKQSTSSLYFMDTSPTYDTNDAVLVNMVAENKNS